MEVTMSRPPSRTSNGQRETLVSLQYLRAVAALLVVFHHAQEQLSSTRNLIGNDFGVGGVDIFFVISGFVMFYTVEKSHLSARSFLARRVVRVVPLYWAMTLLTAALLIAMPSAVNNSKFTVESLVKSLLFLPHVNPGKLDSLHPMLKLGWTLNFEMFFYIIFAMFMFLPAAWRLLSIAAVFSVMAFLNLTIASPPPLIAFFGDIIVYEFLLGGVLALVWRSAAVRAVPLIALGTLIALSILMIPLLSELDVHRLFKRGLPGLILVGAVLCFEQKRGRIFQSKLFLLLGDASYSIYLSHLYAMVFFRIMWRKLDLSDQSIGFGIFYVSLCVVVGVLGGIATFRYVERPLTRAARAGFGRLKLL